MAARLFSDLRELMSQGDSSVSAFPIDDTMRHWTATIKGGQGTVYDKLDYKLSIEFPEKYPYEPPTIKFSTPCYHPNVDTQGNICLDILKEKWSASYNVRLVLLSIQSLLADPNLDSPLNAQAAELWKNKKEYAKTVVERYEKDKLKELNK
ncbi:ubiquitin-conjugating enzyme E2 C-like [Actinia tenebrosa]|uniref:Ubiquitin-conjugating enzyme E2 C-like n=1 Tax=Actinia tenebrosa TaxID=6105 RepID=A0A6P8I856_ACTTE|nr:ubiquitin-conjugating enzyme E2 C-like [Actinia tenebrosa]